MKFLTRFEAPIYALLRFVAGFMFACHGFQKILGLMGGHKVTGGMPMASGFIELIGGSMIALGLLTGVAAFIASGEMAVAYFMAHAPKGFWPIENKGELAVLYCFLFLFMAARGSGSFSLDHAFSKKR